MTDIIAGPMPLWLARTKCNNELTNMDFSGLSLIVLRAIDKVFAHDSFLIDKRVGEWAIVHRFAFYLEQELPEWNIDCESQASLMN